jgi:hypothetical protein
MNETKTEAGEIITNGHVLQIDRFGLFECRHCGYGGHSVEDVSRIKCRDFSDTDVSSRDVAWDTILHMGKNYDSFKIEDIKEEYLGIPAGTSQRTLRRTLSVAVELGVLSRDEGRYVVEFEY